MCGIAGILLKEPKDVPGEWISKMLETLKHRGPDASGIWKIPGMALGNTRLKILDLSDAANQPFTDGSDVLVFNGRIFNYQQLRDELKSRFIFKTTCDTEVLFRALQVWDEEALNKVSGQFAFAFYRKASGSLMLARDHAGICPLYVRETSRGFFFASEIKPLLSLEPAKMDSQGVADFFAYRYNIQNGRTMFDGIKRFAPAHYLKIDTRSGKSQERRYWRLKFTDERLADDELQTEFGRIMDREVELQKSVDVPVGMYLSGGIDSGALLSGFAKTTANINSLTMTFARDADDDYKRVVELSGKYKFNRREIEFTENDLDCVEDVVGALEDPFGDLIICANYLLAKTVSKDVTVVLSGEGGDEAFCGYDHQKAFFKLLPLQVSPVQRTILSSILRIMPSRLLGLLQNYPGTFGSAELAKIQRVVAGMDNPGESYIELVSLFNSEELKSLFARDFLADHSVEPDKEPLRKIFAEEKEPWKAVMRAEIEQLTLVVNLIKQDRFGMHFSLESCVPFVSRDVLNFAASLPFHVHNSKVNKEILLKYSGHRVTKKKPFSLFATQRYHRKLVELLNRYVTEESIRESGVLSWGEISRLKVNVSDGSILSIKRAMAVLVFCVWWKRFKGFL